MMAPKSVHLVERAAERLLRAGALEGSAAQLLEPDATRAPPAAHPPPIDPAPPVAPSTPVAPVSVLATEPPHGELAEPPERPSHLPRPLIDMAALQRAGMFDWSHG